MNKKAAFRHLNYEDRVMIAVLRRHGESIRSIALTIGRSPNTIARELREKQVRGTYGAKKAQHKSYVRRWRSKVHCMRVAMNPHLSQLVHEKLALGWSPERIAGYATTRGMPLSHKAVYKYVRAHALDHHLFWEKHKKKRGRRKGYRSPQDRAKKLIGMRPPVVSSGHFELDFIVSRKSAAVLLVLVDRWTRYTIVRKLYRKTHHAVLRELTRIKARHRLYSITTDNDIVFRDWTSLEASLSVPFFFASPYHSWEKGLVENTNRWIRTVVAKGSDLALVTLEQLLAIHMLLNKTPRQCLGYRTAEEVLLANRVS
jgi:transposase, IS30 family